MAGVTVQGFMSSPAATDKTILQTACTFLQIRPFRVLGNSRSRRNIDRLISMPANTTHLPSSREPSDRRELADRIAAAITADGTKELQPGLFAYRRSTASEPLYGVLDPSLCIIAQGSKLVISGNQRLRYDPAHYLIGTVGVPVVGHIVDASPARPYLSVRLLLDPAVVTSVMVESGTTASRSEANVSAVDVSKLDPPLLDAVLRLIRLINAPLEYRVLGQLAMREIIFRLLTGSQGSRLRHIAQLGGQSHRVTRAVQRLRADYTKPLRIESLARELAMSVSSFHSHFKAVTSMSPLQFQKNLRLQEARRLMFAENLDAAEAGYRVGYDDASHFSRDYKRHFGEPPVRNVERLRVLVTD